MCDIIILKQTKSDLVSKDDIKKEIQNTCKESASDFGGFEC